MYNSSIIPAVCDTEHSNALVTIMIMTLISVIQQLTVCDTEHSNTLVTIMIMTLISVIQQLTVCHLIEKITS